ncbi:MFS permease [Bifidobacterium longum subsp. longum]|nr:MFS permease [Bifidobacterium longum subsp. longum]
MERGTGHVQGNHTVRPGHVRDQARRHGARQGRADRQRDARRGGRPNRQRRQIREKRWTQGVPGRPLRAQVHRQGRQARTQGAQAEGRGLRVGGHRTLPASRAERRGGADRHVPGRRQHASGRRHQPPAVGRADAPADALRQAQEGVRPDRRMAQPAAGGASTRTCSWTVCGTSAHGAGRSRT